jgi:hypothetical protein
MPSEKERIALLEGRITTLEGQMAEVGGEHLPRLYARSEDLNDRLKAFEAHMYDLKAQALAELNAQDARITELERPEVEDDAK